MGTPATECSQIRISQIIFDVDGTLANTAQVGVPALQAAALDYGWPVRDPLTIARTIGVAGIEYYRRLYPDRADHVLTGFALAVEARERALMQELGEDLLFPGVKELLTALVARGYALSIASTGTPEHVGAILAATGIGPSFAVRKYGHSDKAAMVRELVGEGDRRQWVMVGDKEFDWRAAKENGITAVGAGYGFGSESEQAGFDSLIQTPLELLAWLGIRRESGW